MDSVIKSFWFWLLIIGVALILTSILIAGGMKEMKGWTWAIFVVGCVLAILGIIFAFVAWSKYTPCESNPVEKKESIEISQQTPEITRVSVNVPQAERGFSATSMNLSSLAPESR